MTGSYDYDDFETYNDEVDCPFCDAVNRGLATKIDIEKSLSGVITCCKCGKDFRAKICVTRETRRIIQQNWRVEAEPAVCEICGDDNYAKHRLIHGKWVCAFCEDVVLNQQSLAI